MTAIQAAPVHFDREASTEKACRLIAEAADKGATIVAFGECWIPGYPMFAYASPTPLRWKASAAYIASAVEIPGVETEQLCKSTKKAKIDVVIGVAELDERTKSQRSMNVRLGVREMGRRCASTTGRMAASVGSTAGSIR
jgi:predicted amidohydrolase